MSFSIIPCYCALGSSEEVTFDLEEKIFLLLAYGSMSGDTPGYHERKTSSAENIQLQSTSAVQASADSDLFVQVLYKINNYNLCTSIMAISYPPVCKLICKVLASLSNSSTF